MRPEPSDNNASGTTLPDASFGSPSAIAPISMTELIHARIADNADCIAVEHHDTTMTYAQLDAAASALASQLRADRIGPGDVVGVFLRRSISMVVAILGILKVGAAYAPQDARIAPPSQLSHIADITGMRAVLTTAEFAHRMPASPHAILVDEVRPTTNGGAPHPARSSDPCVVIFTSGTTGMPNGVVVTHGNLANLLGQAPGNLGIVPGTRVGQILNIAFDMAAWEILGTLSNGGTLVIRGSDIAATADTVDVLIATPSIVAGLSSARSHAHTVVVAGERCPQALADEWSVGRRFLNSCGPTEITIVNTMTEHTPGAALTIGAPVPGTNVYVLDDHGRPVAIGEVGEMWVSGAGVTAGYLRNPSLTSERYVADPFDPNGGRMFRTRDLGRWTERGMLEHLSRTDDQVKVRGFRVELDSVSRALESDPRCEKAVVLQLDSRTLGAVITPATADPDAARAAAAALLPYYGIPDVVHVVDSLPLTERGKTDRTILRRLLTEVTRREAAA